MAMIAHRTGGTSAASLAALAALVIPLPADAVQANPRHAQIVVDADSNQVLYEENASAPRRPASITKVMTLYMLFDALKAGTISWDDRIRFSRFASAQAPTKLGVPAGGSISVQTAVEALIVRSANDVAAAVAEAIGGSERNFASMMTDKARQLGMANTQFGNASGLPHPQQVSTAEDLAKLAIAIRRDFPEHYHWFSTRSMVWNGQTINGHNHLLGRVDGVDGLKTGYTRASGFNLAATAQRGGRRVVTVVLGGANRFERDDLVEALIETAFTDMGVSARAVAAASTPYQATYADARDAADAAALVMDIPGASGPPAQASNAARIIVPASLRSQRRLSFDPAARRWSIATIIGPKVPVSEAGDEDDRATDEAEAPAPVRTPLPARVYAAADVSQPARPQVTANAAPRVRVPSAPAAMTTPARAPQPAPAATAGASASGPATAAGSASGLRGSLADQPLPPTPRVGQAAITEAVRAEATRPVPQAPPGGEPAARQDMAAMAVTPPSPAATRAGADTITDGTLNGSVDVSAPLSPAPTTPLSVPSGDGEVRMAELDPDLVEQARRRQEQASARERERLALALADETARKAAERASLQRLQAEREARAREARQLAEAKARAERELAEARAASARQAEERRMVAERAEAVRAERERQASAARAANARGTAIVQVGAFKDEADARATLSSFARHFPSFAKREVTTVNRADGTWYRARFSGLATAGAREACKLVTGRGGACQIVAE